ncbi:MAG TPA: 30S ribosomal protein S18 [Fimbriimonadaceae bacterium]|nr:30S ribosomal protein S18 [Fimbriimonadaceae bacterium]
MSEETTKPRPAEPAGDDRARGGFQRDKDTSEGFRKGKRRRKVSYLTINKIDSVDYKEVNILRRFLNDRGKIIPSRQSGNTARQQRMIAIAIRRAREMALLPFAVTEMSADRREYRGERRYPREARPEQAVQTAPEAAPVTVAPEVQAPAPEAPAPAAEAAAPPAE